MKTYKIITSIILVLLLILEIFVNSFWVNVAEVIITLLFAVELIVYYRQSELCFLKFMKRNWIEFFFLLPIFKIFKLLKPLKLVKKLKLTKSIKFLGKLDMPHQVLDIIAKIKMK